MADTVTVWLVEQGTNPPGVTVAVYANEAAALRHVELWDHRVLDGHSDMLRVRAWAVQSESVLKEWGHA